MNRRQVLLKKWDDLEKKHCKKCKIKTKLRIKDPSSTLSQKYCMKECEIGLEIQEIGKQLLKRGD